MESPQFSLRSLFAFATLAALACGIAVQLGAAPVILGFALIFAIFGWGYFYNIAPDATKYFTVLAVIGGVMLSLVSIGLLHARENARRNQSLYNLRQLGIREEHRAASYPSAAVGQHGFAAKAAFQLEDR